MASGTTRCSLDEVGNFILIKVLSQVELGDCLDDLTDREGVVSEDGFGAALRVIVAISATDRIDIDSARCESGRPDGALRLGGCRHQQKRGYYDDVLHCFSSYWLLIFLPDGLMTSMTSTSPTAPFQCRVVAMRLLDKSPWMVAPTGTSSRC